jgi:IPT/TIG domain
MPRRLWLVALPVVSLGLSLTGCSNAFNPFCGNSRPAPLIGSLSPNTVSFAQLQQGVTLTVNGSNFVPASEVVVGGKALGATDISSQELKVTLSTDVVSAPGKVNVKVMTPSGNSGDVGCSSGGTSTALVLTVTQ